MSNAIAGWSTTLGYSADGNAYTTLAEVEDISGPAVSVTVIDVSHLTSPLEWKEKLDGFADAGEVTFKLNFLKAEYAALFNLVDNGGLYYWKVSSPQQSTWVMRGFISKLGSMIPTDGKISTDVTLSISGKPTFTQ